MEKTLNEQRIFLEEIYAQLTIPDIAKLTEKHASMIHSLLETVKRAQEQKNKNPMDSNSEETSI
jgi:hypothetical protein